jgi:NADH-quinone oxidoreductase subunit E
MTQTAPAVDSKRVAKVLAHYPAGEPGHLVNLLHDLQAEFRYLPEEALRQAAAHLGVPPARIFGVATFYEGFHLKPRGEHIVTVCMGTACHVRGSPRLLDQLGRDLAILPGGTTPDLQVTLETVNCVGACALGPLVIVDGNYHGNMTTGRLGPLTSSLRKKEGTKVCPG